MSEAQRAQAHALLKTGLSQRGYMTATAIMDLENVLRTGKEDRVENMWAFARATLALLVEALERAPRA